MGTTRSSETAEFAAYLASQRTTTAADVDRSTAVRESYSLTSTEAHSFDSPMTDTATYSA